MKRILHISASIMLTGSILQAQETYNAVENGKVLFETTGCMVCHAVDPDDKSAKTGPNLYGLFNSSIQRIEVVNQGSDKKHIRKADRYYFNDSVRKSNKQLAVARQGPTKGQAYPAAMPSYTKAAISDADLEAIWHYLRTRTVRSEAGPAKVMITENQAANAKLLIEIEDEVIVNSRPRVFRIGLERMSPRALQVGQPNGIHYTFDPRFLSVRRVWSGGFLNLRQELRRRGGQPVHMGHGAKAILDEAPLLAPLTAGGEVVDFEFKEPDIGDFEAVEKYAWEKKDFMDRLKEVDAEYLGHKLEAKTMEPSFLFRVGENVITQTVTVTEKGEIEVVIEGLIKREQKFQVRTDGIGEVSVAGGALAGGVWTLSPSNQMQTYKLSAQITAKIPDQSKRRIAAGGVENWAPQELVIKPSKPGQEALELPPGYAVRSWISPRDLYSRPQLFESTGIDVAKDGTIVIATRTAGIWRIRDGQWSLFAEGTFESLGVCIEDDKGDQIVITQKPELTRIKDTDGDGRADRFETVCDDFGFHGNYSEYTHGPVRDAEGNYYFNLNLAHAGNHPKASWRAGGKYMGSMGGYRGWACRVTPDGTFEPFANGLRSPAGIAMGPDGRIWYTENQGEYVGTSFVVPLEKGAFYGHPSGLIDLPGVIPESAELDYKLWDEKLRKSAVWFPHATLANSPGNPTWDMTGGKFGPYDGQMFVGDQTLSTLLRVVTEQDGGVDQGCVILFARGFLSGLMRPQFLPDGSLLIGQTGRGWGAKGGEQEALQQVVWDGKTIPADIHNVKAAPQGFVMHFTQPLAGGVSDSDLMKALKIKSWFYKNTSNYGSGTLKVLEPKLDAVNISADRQSIELRFKDFGQGEDWIDRMYEILLGDSTKLFAEPIAHKELGAYYTLRSIPE